MTAVGPIGPYLCPVCLLPGGDHKLACDAPKTMTRMIEDGRPIKAVHFSETGAPSYTVGVEGVTRIEPYEENGEMAAVTWLAVWCGQHLWLRFPARDACIEY